MTAQLPGPGQWVDALDLEGQSDPMARVEAEVPVARLGLEGCRVSRVRLELEVARTGAPGSYEYEMSGRVSGDATVTCVRCLVDAPLVLDATFALRQLPISLKPLEADGGGEHEVLDSEVDIEYYSRPVFDLLSLVREQVYLGLPMDPVCREDCAGLCPRCGADRNLGAHECAGKAIDPRREALKGLKPTTN